MSEIGVLVKVPAELHAELKRASLRHKRSMQKVVLALLEGWIERGAPDPLKYGETKGTAEEPLVKDPEAREAMVLLAKQLTQVNQRMKAIEEELEREKCERSERIQEFSSLYTRLQKEAKHLEGKQSAVEEEDSP